MKRLPVIVIFDVGKTNKKILVFDDDYNLIHESNAHLTETADEDGFPCEDVHALSSWLTQSYTDIRSDQRFEVRAVNFAAYGASFVLTDRELKPLFPLCNYLKPYPENLLQTFYRTYGGKVQFATRTASPVLGSLNSGMQLYRMKKERPDDFSKVHYALHLPQYLSAILTKHACSEITSIGCHTNLWDFTNKDYHDWVKVEGLAVKFPVIEKSSTVIDKSIRVGIGLHDSSAALIPYLAQFDQPFMLLSTGTWAISLNPFNQSPLTEMELQDDCLCYLNFRGEPVKASRLFAGHEHDVQTARIASHFQMSEEDVINCSPSDEMINSICQRIKSEKGGTLTFAFQSRGMSEFNDHREAYCELLADLVRCQRYSSNLLLKESDVTDIFVDGGFSRNKVYMKMLSSAFASYRVMAATVAQASALGAALVIHDHWNTKPVRRNLVMLK
jgi:sugar (pentulose or hexulose) kinase